MTVKRRLLTNFILFLISTLFSLYIIEFVASRLVENEILGGAVLDWRNYDTHIINCFQLSENLGYEPIWGKCGYLDIATSIETQSTKVLGETNEEKYKILIVGDSNTYRGNFDKLLEEKLNTIFKDSNKHFSVLKIGVESYNTYQEVELLNTKAIKLNPNMIILQFTLNDFWFSSVALRIDDRIVYFSPRGEKSFETNNFLFKYSSLYRFYALNKLLVDEAYLADSNQDAVFLWEDKVKSMDKTLDIYREMVKGYQIPSVVLIYPQFSGRQPERERNTILDLLKKKDLDFIDLLPLTEDFGGPAYFQSYDNGQVDSLHPQRNFDSIAADALTQYIVKTLEEGDNN